MGEKRACTALELDKLLEVHKERDVQPMSILYRTMPCIEAQWHLLIPAEPTVLTRRKRFSWKEMTEWRPTVMRVHEDNQSSLKESRSWSKGTIYSRRNSQGNQRGGGGWIFLQRCWLQGMGEEPAREAREKGERLRTWHEGKERKLEGRFFCCYGSSDNKSDSLKKKKGENYWGKDYQCKSEKKALTAGKLHSLLR